MPRKKAETTIKQERKDIVRSLPCELRDDERLQFGVELSAALSSRTEAVQERKDAMDHWKGVLGEIESRIARLSRIVETGIEYRETECELTRDFEAGTVITVRKDTGEEIDNRPMRADERQRSLPAT